MRAAERVETSSPVEHQKILRLLKSGPLPYCSAATTRPPSALTPVPWMLIAGEQRLSRSLVPSCLQVHDSEEKADFGLWNTRRRGTICLGSKCPPSARIGECLRARL